MAGCEVHSLVFLSGPDGIAHHRSHTPLDKRVIGNYQHTPLLTTDTDYLWRSNPQGTPVHLRSKSSTPGEIGWHARIHMSWYPIWTGHGKLMSEFWRQAEDDYTHRYQDAWYPSNEEDLPYNPEPKYFYYTKYMPQPNKDNSPKKDSPAAFAGIKASNKHQERPGIWRQVPEATQNIDFVTENSTSTEVAESLNNSQINNDRSENASRNSKRLLNLRYSAQDQERQQQNRSLSANIQTSYAKLPPTSSARGSISYN